MKSKKNIALSKDTDLIGAEKAIKRAALDARRVAIETNTEIIVRVGDRLIRIDSEELSKKHF